MVVYIETAEGGEHVVVNLAPGTTRTVPLADGRSLTTDGLAVRVSRAGLVLAGGTFAEIGGPAGPPATDHRADQAGRPPGVGREPGLVRGRRPGRGRRLRWPAARS